LNQHFARRFLSLFFPADSPQMKSNDASASCWPVPANIPPVIPPQFDPPSSLDEPADESPRPGLFSNSQWLSLIFTTAGALASWHFLRRGFSSDQDDPQPPPPRPATPPQFLPQPIEPAYSDDEEEPHEAKGRASIRRFVPDKGAPPIFVDFEHIRDLAPLNEGHFGRVFQGKFGDRDIVLKLSKRKPGSNEWGELIALRHLPPHPCVSSIIGICVDVPQNFGVANAPQGSPSSSTAGILYEFQPGGSLGGSLLFAFFFEMKK
jgi:hypothetical protein